MSQNSQIFDRPVATDKMKLLRGLPSGLDEWIFFGFLGLVVIGLEPFRPRDAAFFSQTLSGEGDSLRQLSYAATFVFSMLRSYQKRLIYTILGSYKLFWLATILLLTSTIWSVSPDLTFRRAILTIMVAWTAISFVYIIGPVRTLRSARLLLGIVIVIDLFSIPFVPQAIHNASEGDPALTGAWRGMHLIKSIAGPVAVLSSFIFLYYWIENKRKLDLILLIFSVSFLAGTSAKAPQAIMIMCALLLYFYGTMFISGKYRTLARVFVILSLFATIIAPLIFIDTLAEAIESRSFLTGRGVIWQTAWTYVQSNWALGAGYGAFWEGGPAQEIFGKAGRVYLTHSHNGFLEMLVTTGILGVTIGVISCVVFPIWKIFYKPANHYLVTVPWIVFFVAMNMTETYLFARDQVVWVLFLLALSIIQFRPTPSDKSF